MKDPLELVKIYEAANSIEANLVKNLLAEEGVEAVVAEENDPLSGLSIDFSPDVMVRAADEERARAFIDNYEEKLIEEAEKEDEDESSE